MPRRKAHDPPGPKTRSRFGCWPCKRRRIKCGEERPICSNCERLGDEGCDYTLRLNWDAHVAPPPPPPSNPAVPSEDPTEGAASSSTSKSSAAEKPNTSAKRRPSRFVYLYDGQSKSNAKRSLTSPTSPSLGTGESSRSKSTSGPEDSASSLMPPASGHSHGQASPRVGAYAGFGQSYTGPVQQPGVLYGYDQGRPDLDIPRNDDENALVVFDTEARPLDPWHQTGLAAHSPPVRSFRCSAQAYYADPVPALIPRAFEPLPDLLHNPMNLLYFSFFINYSSCILLPCSCPANMLRTDLPRMALQNDNLLKLTLVFAAHHRARLLHKPYPKARIATLAGNVFSMLREAMTGAPSRMTNEHICVALFLATLEIIDLNAFDTPALGWEEHLSLAMECVRIRGGIEKMRESDPVAAFLSHWAGYLDVLGSLSSQRYSHPMVMSGMRCEMEQHSADCGHPTEALGEETENQCCLGYTDQSMNNIAEITHMIRSYTPGRLGADQVADKDWRPSPRVEQRAQRLIKVMNAAKQIPSKPCPAEPEEYQVNSAAVSQAYYEAGLIHLYRRVLNFPAESPEVQASVAAVMAQLDNCDDCSLLFMTMPLCAAGLEALQEPHRRLTLECLDRIEELGFLTAQMDRTLCMRVWSTGLNWEAHYEGQYLG